MRFEVHPLNYTMRPFMYKKDAEETKSISYQDGTIVPFGNGFVIRLSDDKVVDTGGEVKYSLTELREAEEKMMDIFDKINKGHYKTKISRPTEYDFTRFWVYKKGTIILKNADREEYGKWISSANREPGVTVEKIVDKPAYKTAMEEYRKHERDMREQFRDDALREAGLDHLKTKNEIFQFAWDEAHDCGIKEVYYKLIDMTDMFEGLINKE